MIDARLQRETDFHDQRFGNEDEIRRPAEKYYAIIGHARNEYKRRISANSAGKRILEYGCGTGSDAFDLAAAGAHVTGIDISIEAIHRAEEIAGQRNLTIDFRKMNAEELDFDDSSFDVICGTGILHHLDLDKALSEISRVLAPGGCAVFTEPLGHNPLINLYRTMTPSMRTIDEHPLMMADIRNARKVFGRVDVSHYNLTTLCTVPFRNLSVFNRLFGTFTALDNTLMKVIPFARRYSWMVVLEFSAPNAQSESADRSS